jgi:hypothetical protein
MTRATFFTLALVLMIAGLAAGGCSGDDSAGGDGQLAQSPPGPTPRTESARKEPSGRAEPSRSDPQPGSAAKSPPKRVSRKQLRGLRSAEEKLRKKLGVTLPKPAGGCVKLQGDPRLTRLIEANRGCKQQTAPDPAAPPPGLDLPSLTDPKQP